MKYRNRIPENEKPTIVQWYDAQSQVRISDQELKDAKDTRDLMAYTKSIGWPIYEDEFALVLCSEVSGRDDEAEFDINVIPKCWIVKRE
ncbi:MAG: hypothetical protein PHU12_03610 [Candidatus Aenigmarchaeota archaeon]|nr:hypothetical protein [Candidatus Aenigmarchaeota archaeon]